MPTSLKVVRIGMLVCLLAGLVIMATPALAQPQNDHYWEPITISSPPFHATIDTTGATMDSGELQVCPGTQIGATVWFKYVAPFNGGLVLDTMGSNFDTIITVIDPGAVYPCNDDAQMGAIRFRQSQVSLTALTGQTYYFEVGGSNGATGKLEFSVNRVPNNDLVIEAQPLSLPYTAVVTNWAATLENGEAPVCVGETGTLWYKITVFSSTPLVFDTSGSNFDTTVSVFEWIDAPGDLAQQLRSPAGFPAIGCSDDVSGSDRTSRMTWQGRGVDFDGRPHTYYIEAGGKNGSQGILKFTLSTVALPSVPQGAPATPNPMPSPVNFPAPMPPPAGGPFDMFANAFEVPVAPYALAGDNRGAGLESSEPRPCVSLAYTQWFTVVATTTQSLIAQLRPIEFSGALAVYRQDGSGVSGLSLLACSYEGPGGPSVAWQASAGARYYVQVGGWSAKPSGTYLLDILRLS